MYLDVPNQNDDLNLSFSKCDFGCWGKAEFEFQQHDLPTAIERALVGQAESESIQVSKTVGTWSIKKGFP